MPQTPGLRLKPTLAAADNNDMAVWLSKIIHAFGGEAGNSRAVRRVLREVQLANVKLALELSSARHKVVMSAGIEQVRNDDLVISQPTLGGMTHPLAFGEQVTITFTYQSLHHYGESECLGRVRIPAGDSSHVCSPHTPFKPVLYGYRLALPRALHKVERRSQSRSQFELPQTIEAQLYAPASLVNALQGHIADLNMMGARIVLPSPGPHFVPGQNVYLKAMLPDPAGLIDELVTVSRIDRDQATGECMVGLRFQRRVEGLEKLMRTTRRVA